MADEGVRDVPTAIILQFISTFGVWILADRLGLSSVLTMVTFAIAVARRAPERTPARLRVPSYAVWETAVFVLNVLAFVFIGLQIRPILTSLDPDVRTRYLFVAGLVLLTVIVVRIAWVMTHNTVASLEDPPVRIPSARGRSSRPTVGRRPGRFLGRHARRHHARRGARASRTAGAGAPFRIATSSS